MTDVPEIKKSGPIVVVPAGLIDPYSSFPSLGSHRGILVSHRYREGHGFEPR